MNTAVIITKTEPEVKKKAQALAREFGMSLSSLINTYLKQVVRTKKINLYLDEEPSPYLVKILKKSRKNYTEGKGSPVLKTGEEAVKWLEEQGI